MVKGFVSYLRANKKIAVTALAMMLGISLLLLSASKGEVTVVNEQTLGEYKAELEAELEELCSLVNGAGKCRVSVSFERGAENTYKGSNLIETKPPRVMGVAVLCEGADSDEVRAELISMLCALFNIGSNRIAVLKLN